MLGGGGKNQGKYVQGVRILTHSVVELNGRRKIPIGYEKSERRMVII